VELFENENTPQCSLYVIGWRERGPVKFGVAIDPVARLAGLQTGNPYRLRIYRAWWLPSQDDALRAETMCLERFSGVSLVGEWAQVTKRQAIDAAAKIILERGLPVLTWAPTPEQLAARAKIDKRVASAAGADALAEMRHWRKN